MMNSCADTPPNSLSFVIVGGGTAGWMTALLFQQRWPQATVTVLESPAIGIIGVGEGSTPSLKRFFQQLGIEESCWMAACHATYKVNIRFCHWSPAAAESEYSHPFISQLDTFSERAFYQNCLLRRYGLNVETRPERFLLNGWLAQQHLAPVAPAHFPLRQEYGYHFDSALLGQFLAKQAVQRGIRHLPCTVTAVEHHPDGRIRQVVTEQAQAISGDVFVDCSGFQSLLLQQSLEVPFHAFSNNLFNNAAVVLPGAVNPVLPVETRATALSNGWAWQIPLTHRTGHGYVYCQDHLNADAAETELRQHLGVDDQTPARHLSMRVGQVARHWEKNCVAIGLAQGFIEPLEATALHLVQTSVEIFMDLFEQGQYSTQFQAHYNQQISERFERVRDYIVAHYKLNTRDDSDYWRANRANLHLSESLLQLLDVWYRQGDLGQEIQRQQLQSHFGTTSWHCLLAGYGVFPPLVPARQPHPDHFDQAHLAHLFGGSVLNFQQQRDLLQQQS